MDGTGPARAARRRVGGALRWGGIALVPVVLADTALAQEGFDSTTEELIRTLDAQLLYLAIPIAVLVEVVLVYAVVRFRNAEEPTPTADNRRLEVTWTIATGLVLLFVGLASYQVMTSPYVASPHGSTAEVPEDAVEVRVIGQQWYWSVAYPDENVSVSDVETIYVPTDRPVYFVVVTRDVIHSMHVPGLGLKADAIPGHRHVIETVITDEGSYRLYCAEYCGTGHPNMTATVRAVPPSEYREWLDARGANRSDDGRQTDPSDGDGGTDDRLDADARQEGIRRGPATRGATGPPAFDDFRTAGIALTRSAASAGQTVAPT